MDVVGVGALNVDLLYEVPSLQVGGIELAAGGVTYGTEELFYKPVQELMSSGRLMGRSGGGSAANTTYALARLGYQTAFLGVVGKDNDGAFILESMSGVDVSRVKRYRNSGKCISLLAPGGRSQLVLPNANDFFSYTEDDIALLNSSKFVHMGPFVADSALASQKMLLEYLDENVYLSFSPGEPYARRGVAQLQPLLERTRILFLDRNEMKLLTGQGPADGARELLETGPRIVVCTLGEEGSLIMTRNSEVAVSTKRTVVNDVAGAGDVYAAGFLAGYLDGATLEACGKIAAAASALSIASYGREGYPDERFLRTFAKEL